MIVIYSERLDGSIVKHGSRLSVVRFFLVRRSTYAHSLQVATSRNVRLQLGCELRDEFTTHSYFFYQPTMRVIDMSKGQGRDSQALMQVSVLLGYGDVHKLNIGELVRHVIKQGSNRTARLTPGCIKSNCHNLMSFISHHRLIFRQRFYGHHIGRQMS